MNILLTGATGLVGNSIYESINKKHNLISLIRKNNSEFDPEKVLICDLYEDDIDCENYAFDILIHCAALIPNSINKFSDEKIAEINKIIDKKIIDFCLKKNIKLIFISSTSVYDMHNNGAALNENSMINPILSYSKEKHWAEVSIMNNLKNYIILRLNSPYGYKQKNNNVLKIFVENAIAGKPLTYYGTGSRTQDFVNVKDISNAVDLSMNCHHNSIYNIASGDSIGMKQLAELVSKCAKINFASNVDIVQSNLEDPQENLRMSIDISKAKNELHWIPTVVLYDAIKEWMMRLKQK